MNPVPYSLAGMVVLVLAAIVAMISSAKENGSPGFLSFLASLLLALAVSLSAISLVLYL